MRGWTGQLANGGETIELSTPFGEVVNAVRYATEGDWGRRERGLGAEQITSITRSGSTVTVQTSAAHGFTGPRDNYWSEGRIEKGYK